MTMNQTCSVFDLTQAKAWRAAWEKLPLAQRSVYLLPEYYAVYEGLHQGEACCFFYEAGGHYWLYPFLKKNLDFLKLETPQSFDAEGAYGLNGAGHSNLDSADLKTIEKVWSEYCSAEHIIAEFTRLNPMLGSPETAPYLLCSLANQAVVVDLGCENLLYDSYEHSVRKAIKKAERLGVTIENYSAADLPATYLSEFCRIYEATMDRKSASDFYYFGEKYFTAINSYLGDNARWFFAVLDGSLVSVELVLFDEYCAYSFLGGTLKEYLACGANVLLKHRIICYFQQQLLAYYFLGGGNRLNDGIYSYKKTFSKKEPVPFYIGKKVHSEQGYTAAVKKWEILHPGKCETYKNFFLKYRC